MNREELTTLQTLQEQLISPPVFGLPRKGEYYTLQKYPCDRQIGCVLLQIQVDSVEKTNWILIRHIERPRNEPRNCTSIMTRRCLNHTPARIWLIRNQDSGENVPICRKMDFQLGGRSWKICKMETQTHGGRHRNNT